MVRIIDDILQVLVGGYSVRLVKSGRYFHHWSLVNVDCGGVGTVVEVKVWPDCVEVHMVADASTGLKFVDGGGGYNYGVGQLLTNIT